LKYIDTLCKLEQSNNTKFIQATTQLCINSQAANLNNNDLNGNNGSNELDNIALKA